MWVRLLIAEKAIDHLVLSCIENFLEAISLISKRFLSHRLRNRIMRILVARIAMAKIAPIRLRRQ
jgi:hypothetical protein